MNIKYFFELVFYNIFQERQADDLFEPYENPLAIAPDAELSCVDDILLVHGGAFPAVMHICIAEGEKIIRTFLQPPYKHKMGGGIHNNVLVPEIQNFFRLFF